MSAEDRICDDLQQATLAIHAGHDPRKAPNREVMPSICVSSNYQYDDPFGDMGFLYSRLNNPTRDVAETCLAALENAKHGLLFSSGSAAVATVCGLLKPGDHIVAADLIYGGSTGQFKQLEENRNIQVTFVDPTKVDDVSEAIRQNTKFVWIENPSNPLVTIADVKAIGEVCKAHNVILAVDSTFATPIFQRPLDLGATVVMHSISKYINGHSDIIMGGLLTNDSELAKRLKTMRTSTGNHPSTMDCYLVYRSIRTLPVRMKQHEVNAMAVAEYLESHPMVDKVLYPGMKSHPQHDLAKAQMSGFGGMIAFYVKGDAEQSKAFLASLKIILLANSLGSIESLVGLPIHTTHSGAGEELGVTNSLVRLSVGIEAKEDLIRDLKQALDIVAKCQEE